MEKLINDVLERMVKELRESNGRENIEKSIVQATAKRIMWLFDNN